MDNLPHNKDRTLYGRRQGRPLSSERQSVLDLYLSDLSLKPQEIETPASLDPQNLFSKPCTQFIFEIGFGNGEHLAEMMRQNPDTGFIGAEPYINGMAAFLKDIKTLKKERIRVWMHDALDVIRSLQDNSLDAIYVLNPDPWPKTRHHKRRIIRSENLDEFARVLKPGAQLIMTTDVNDLADWMVTQTYNHGAFTWTAQSCHDWNTPPNDWIPTRYEQKGIAAGRQQTYLFFEKNLHSV